MAKETGRVVQIQGSVVDVAFPEGSLPDVFEAIEIPRLNAEPLVLEVEKHLGNNWVRCVSMDTTDGLERGVEVIGTGAPIMVPVGPATLGRIFNVLGRPVDNLGDVKANAYYPIHRPAPLFSEQSTHTEIFETGIKVIDIFIGILEFISEIAKIISFTFRLFGNVFAEMVLVTIVLAKLEPFVIPIGLRVIFGIGFGLIQAFVFSILTVAYINLATEKH